MLPVNFYGQRIDSAKSFFEINQILVQLNLLFFVYLLNLPSSKDHIYCVEILMKFSLRLRQYIGAKYYDDRLELLCKYFSDK